MGTASVASSRQVCAVGLESCRVSPTGCSCAPTVFPGHIPPCVSIAPGARSAEGRSECSKGAGNSGALHGGDDQRSDDPECGDIAGERDRHQDDAEDKAKQPAVEDSTSSPRPDALADVVKHDSLLFDDLWLTHLVFSAAAEDI